MLSFFVCFQTDKMHQDNFVTINELFEVMMDQNGKVLMEGTRSAKGMEYDEATAKMVVDSKKKKDEKPKTSW